MPFQYDVCNVKLQLRVKGLVLSQEAGGVGGGEGHTSETCSISYMNISKTYFSTSIY